MKNLHKTSHTIINIIKDHIYKNIKQYVVISTIFLIGIIISVILFNNTQTEVKEDISIEINTFI